MHNFMNRLMLVLAIICTISSVVGVILSFATQSTAAYVFALTSAILAMVFMLSWGFSVRESKRASFRSSKLASTLDLRRPS